MELDTGPSFTLNSLEEGSESTGLAAFVEEFKRTRIALGLTHSDVGLALEAICGTSFSQTTMYRFEAMTLSLKNALRLKTLLQKWMDEEVDPSISSPTSTGKIAAKINRLNRQLRGGMFSTHLAGKSFEGIMHTFSFAPSTNILIHGLRFFGPHSTSSNKVEYSITIKINQRVPDKPLGIPELIWNSLFGGRRSIPTVQHVLMEETAFRRGVIRGQDHIDVQLPEPVRVAENKWVDVHFQLDGVPTEYLHQAEVYRTTLYEDTSGIIFHTLIGSRQLKDIAFTLNNDENI